MTKNSYEYLSKREQQIMDIIYRKGKASAAEVYEEMEDVPSYSAARVMMHLLEDKGLLGHEKQGPRYVYFPTVAKEQMRKEELKHVLKTFFDGSATEAMADLLDLRKENMEDEEWQQIFSMIETARKQGR